MAIQEKLATGQGKFTPRYPELGTGPVSYDDAVSEEFFLAEREAVFKRRGSRSGASISCRVSAAISHVNSSGWAR